jgi:hypothetical protein
MHTRILTYTQVLPAPPDVVFRFFESPENLARITPRWLDFRILTPLPIEMKKGTILDYTIRWLGIRLRWRTLITAYEPPRCFVDEQIKGPFSFWHHTHQFEDSGTGTKMTDIVRYVLPFGFLGDLVHPFVVRPQLKKIFDHRRMVIALLPESDANARVPRERAE